MYAYAREDLDFWAAQLGRPLPNGVFGENLTTEGADANGALIGERWRIGPDVILEVSCSADPVRHLPGLAGAGRLGQAVHAGRHARALLPGDRAGRNPGR